MENEEILNIPFESELLYIDDEGDLVIDDRLLPYATNQHTGLWDEETVRKCEANDGTMVTVVCITYNHENYIAEALQSFVDQETDFKFKVFVGDDASEDATPGIIQSYAEMYPDIVVPFCREENLGGMGKRNLIDLCQRATSPYIAFCEGDDYWTDPQKLQKQFNFMNENLDYRICFARTLIDAPEDWYLRSYYVPNKDEELIIPECKPGYKLPEMPMKATQCIDYLPCHTSSLFFRWDYGLRVPDWFFGGLIGDHPIFLMQLGKGNLGYIEDVVSVYRRSEVGVAMNTSTEEHFANTRLDYCHYLLGMRDFVDEHFDGYSRIELENRIKLEVYNYLNTSLKVDDPSMGERLFREYPEAGQIALTAFLSFYHDQRVMTSRYTWNGYKTIARQKLFIKDERKALRQYSRKRKCFDTLKKLQNSVKRRISNARSFLDYHYYATKKKDPSIWVFSSFYKKGYLDNAKYLYEYVVQNHPEIQAYWITLDNAVIEMLEEYNMPVLRAGTKECANIMARATVAVTDHFRMSDFASQHGFNAKTKVVQLWHGVGFKALGDGEKIKNTNVKGVRYSDDLLPCTSDSQVTILRKKWRKFRYSYCRELFEQYFMLVCPGQERIDMLAKPLHVQESAIFIAGHPRNIDLYNQEQDAESFKILYAPTYRFDPRKEADLVKSFLDNLEAIEELMEQIQGLFVFRLHPHTWRNYKSKIQYRLSNYGRIQFDDTDDIYQSLGTYSLAISDYSSLAMDFAMLHRPTIFFCPDYDWFIENEAGFNIDFDNAIPGPKTATWGETFTCIKEYYANPNKDSAWTNERVSYFFDEDANGPDNSERIVQEIKRRLVIEGGG